MSEPTYSVDDLRALIHSHMCALAADDPSAHGSIDYGDFLVDQLIERVKEMAS